MMRLSSSLSVVLWVVSTTLAFGQSLGRLGSSTQDQTSNNPNPSAQTSADATVAGRTNEVVEFPIHANSIAAEPFYDQVISRLHWTTELAAKLSSEMTLTKAGTVRDRIPLESLQILSNFWPNAFELVQSEPGAPPSLLRVNMSELDGQWSQQKLSLRRWLASKAMTPLYEVCGKSGFDGVRENRRLVVVLHGLHGGSNSAITMANAIHEKTGLAACAFCYPNDAPLNESTDYFFDVLDRWHREQPRRKVVIVSHSMGGLIARAVIEQRAASDPDCLGISKFIAICPPNHGSVFAEYAGVLEAADLLQRIKESRSKRKLLATIIDGFNEAPKELVPGSDYLQSLNQASRHPFVRYAIIAGDKGMSDGGLTQLADELVKRFASRAVEIKPLQERATKLLNSAEFSKGSGDGVVTLQSAALPGVSDFKVLPINHLDWADFQQSEGQAVLEEVAKRVGIDM